MAAEVGDTAPDIKGNAHWRGRAEAEEFAFNLGDFPGKRIVLAFYPGDFGAVCTKEMCDFSDNIAALGNLNAQVVGISIDDLDKHRSFAKKYNLSIPLIADTEKTIGEQYDVRPMLGNRHRRAIFIIDPQGKIAFKKIEPTALFRTEAKEIESVLQGLDK